MKQIGFVTKTFKDKVQLEVKRPSGCGSCKGCASSCDTGGHRVTIKNKLNVQEGDYVELTAVSRNLIKFISIVYMIPFAFLIIGILLGNSYFEGNSNQEILSFLVGMVGLALSYIPVRIIDRKISAKGESTVEMTRVL